MAGSCAGQRAEETHWWKVRPGGRSPTIYVIDFFPFFFLPLSNRKLLWGEVPVTAFLPTVSYLCSLPFVKLLR